MIKLFKKIFRGIGIFIKAVIGIAWLAIHNAIQILRE